MIATGTISLNQKRFSGKSMLHVRAEKYSLTLLKIRINIF